MCAFNYRFVPAVRLAREMIEAGELGEIYHFRGRYLQEWIVDPQFPTVWRLDRAEAGSGALGDLGAHVDRSGPLPGRRGRLGLRPDQDLHRASGPAATWTSTTPSRRRSSSRAAPWGRSRPRASAIGRKNAPELRDQRLEGVDRLRARAAQRAGRSIWSDSRPGASAQGFRQVLVTEADHPFWKWWWPHGHMIGWEHTFVHEIHHLLTRDRATTETCAPTARISRTATARPRCATRSCARARPDAARRSPTGPCEHVEH